MSFKPKGQSWAYLIGCLRGQFGNFGIDIVEKNMFRPTGSGRPCLVTKIDRINYLYFPISRTVVISDPSKREEFSMLRPHNSPPSPSDDNMTHDDPLHNFFFLKKNILFNFFKCLHIYIYIF